MNLNTSLSAALLSAAMAVTPAQAVVVDFEDVGFAQCTEAPIVSSHYTFTGDDFFHCVNAAGIPTPNANNGSSFLIEGSFALTITHNHNSRFGLYQVDLGTSFFNETSPNLMTVTGVKYNGSTVSEVLLVSDRFETFSLNGFDDLVALRFSGLLLPDSSGAQGYFALDNAVLIPLPGTVPLALLGLGALAVVHRRRAKAMRQGDSPRRHGPQQR